jgi:hypothetical protein
MNKEMAKNAVHVLGVTLSRRGESLVMESEKEGKPRHVNVAGGGTPLLCGGRYSGAGRR